MFGDMLHREYLISIINHSANWRTVNG